MCFPYQLKVKTCYVFSHANAKEQEFEIVKLHLYCKGGRLKHLVTDVALGPLACRVFSLLLLHRNFLHHLRQLRNHM